MRFCQKFYTTGVKPDTFFESYAVTDLITTCFGGRNRKCAEAYAKDPTKEWDAIEEDIQGTSPTIEVYKVLKRVNALNEFPLFSKIYDIAYAGHEVETIFDTICHVDTDCILE